MTADTNALVNRALVLLYRGLLQYVSESCPWSLAGAAELGVLERLSALQRGIVADLAALLDERNGYVDYGMYPAQFSDLHYVSLDYLAGQMLAHETQVLEELKRLAVQVTGDTDAAALLERAVRVQQEVVAQLRALPQTSPVPA